MNGTMIPPANEAPADLSSVALFVRIAEHGSLSAAGRALGIPKATVSRQLALLEARLGAPLLRRSTRALSLTDVGRSYYERVRWLVREMESAELEIRAAHAEPAGLVRITATTGYGQMVLAPALFAFMAAHPAVRVDLALSDARLNVVAGGFDLAIRMGALEDSDLVSRRLGTVRRVLVAAPQLLGSTFGRASADLTLDDLAGLPAVGTSMEATSWRLADGRELPVRPILAVNGLFVARDAAIAGIGLAQLPAFVVADDLAVGRLIELLPDAPLPDAQATALYPRTTTPSILTKAVLEHLARTLPVTT